MQSDPPVGTRGFPSRDVGFHSPASAVGVPKTPLARGANQRQITQTVGVETLAGRVGPPSLKRGRLQQQQTTMRQSRAAFNSTAADATAAVADAGGEMAKTVVLNSGGSSTGKKVVRTDVAFNRGDTGATATKGITPPPQSPPTTGTRSTGQVRRGNVDREVSGVRGR